MGEDMLIIDGKQLKKYDSKHRIWQGIPSIERTKCGRIFAAFYSGGIVEQLGNYCVLIKSDDDGKTWSEPIACAYKSEVYRCYDQCLWIDPLERLWFIWSVMPEHAVYGAICDNPDADVLKWGEEFKIGHDVMLNKPVVLTTGEWLFPIAVWDTNVFVVSKTEAKDTGTYVYRTVDNGKTFTKLGCPNVVARSYDEHMVVELKNSTLMMLIRTTYGISKSYSYDAGNTWTEAENSLFGGPNARFHIRKLKSGRILLINHYKFSGRNNLTALLSEDEGKTWKYSLLLDERDEISYPDAVETEDGYLYIIYDRERGAAYDGRRTFEKAKADAREILMSKITEDDIINGKIVNKNSCLKCLVSKLHDYDGDAQSLYDAVPKYTCEDLKELLLRTDDNDTALNMLFNFYTINCQNMNKVDIKNLDAYIEKFKLHTEDREKTFEKIIRILNGVQAVKPLREEPITEFIINYINEHFAEDITVDELAKKTGVSLYYLCHLFKIRVGITILEYRDSRRMAEAKSFLCKTDESVTEVAKKCGFDDFNYFIKKFKRCIGLTPLKYREYHRISLIKEEGKVHEK